LFYRRSHRQKEFSPGPGRVWTWFCFENGAGCFVSQLLTGRSEICKSCGCSYFYVFLMLWLPKLHPHFLWDWPFKLPVEQKLLCVSLKEYNYSKLYSMQKSSEHYG
jgi:hypothetical protein